MQESRGSSLPSWKICTLISWKTHNNWQWITTRRRYMDSKTHYLSVKLKMYFKTYWTNKSQCPDGFTAEFHRKFREDLKPPVLKHFNEIERVTILPKSFLKASITLVTKPVIDSTKKIKLYPNEHRHKNSQ